LAVEPHSGSSLESEVWSPMLNLQANFFECVKPLDEMPYQVDFDSGFTESKGSAQPGGSCPEASDSRLPTSD
ncbi:hypothetical protein, partial [uncultured Acidaminococcus sp.]|uniref:hypothetical protein n=1 Tax=uncultured Acidaminococcus sp. TaxID=352152 RepID=UPI002582E1B9